jgi:alkanesulfonate monooxygenase SsuD/methylene tetrahydromethanopterin reductase-like flavin-dependent oxidoreductase (luciferase family)
MEPRPAQRPFPIYLSGNAPDAIERVASLADGWIMSQASPSDVGERVRLLRAHAERTGRDPEAFPIALLVNNLSIDRTEEGASAAFEAAQRTRRSRLPRTTGPEKPRATGALSSNRLVGTPAQIAAWLNEYRAAGVDHVGLQFVATTPMEIMSRAALFATEVMPLME